MSLMYSKNNNGLKMVPWSTPDMTGTVTKKTGLHLFYYALMTVRQKGRNPFEIDTTNAIGI